MWMMNCSNCEKEVDEADPANVQVMHGSSDMHLCLDCQKGVLVMKIVLKRTSVKDDFKFEQYLPVESAK